MFRVLGSAVARRPTWILVGWGVAGILLFAAERRFGGRRAAEPASFLPASSEEQRALALMTEAFPGLAARSQVAVIAFRPGGMVRDDFAWISTLAAGIRLHAEEHAYRWTVLSPSDGYLRRRLTSEDGQAALVVVNTPAFYVSAAAAKAAEAVEGISRKGRPSGLRVELSGTAAAGRDFGRATGEGVHRTLWVTVACVVTILLLVYRSPVAAAVPLIGISVCTIFALRTLDLLAVLGWSVSDMERMFTVVLLYGAGTDFAMFWLARYREEWGASGMAGRRRAVAEATHRVGAAIVASSATTILGLLTLVATEMVPTRNAGKVLGLALLWAPLAGVTLIPALACLAGRSLFWPNLDASGTRNRTSGMWSRLAAAVVQRPTMVLGLGAAVLLPPAVRAGFIRFRYDTMAELPAGSSSARGAAIAAEHFAPGALYPVTLLIRVPEDGPDLRTMRTLSEHAARAVGAVDGVVEVSDLSHPLGSRAGAPGGAEGFLVAAAAEPFYLAARMRTIRAYPSRL